MTDPILVRGAWLLQAADAPLLTDAALRIEDGRVAAVGDWRDLRASAPECEVIGDEHSAIIPGLINAHHHCHAVSAIQHGVSDDLLEPWILAWASMRSADRYLNTLVSLGHQLGAGVTSVVDMMGAGGRPEAFDSSLRQALAACDSAGIRVALAPGATTRSDLVSGPGEDARFLDGLPVAARTAAEKLLPPPGRLDEDDYFAIMESLQAELRGHARIDLWYGPPGPQWVGDEALQRCAEAAERFDCGLQTHVNESLYEKLLGPRAYGRTMMGHLHALGVLGPRLSIAHGTWLTRAEIDLMAETGAALSHNPSSNLRLRAGIAPLTELLAAGVTTAIGMDATTLNEDEDMFAELRLATRLQCDPRIEHEVPGFADVFAAATLGGARLLRREHELGRLDPGFLADLVVLDTRRLCWPWVAPEADPFELIVLRAQRLDVRRVLVAGETVWRDGGPTRFDLAAAAAELAARLAAQPASNELGAAVREVLPWLRRWYAGWELPELDPWRIQSSRK